MDTASDFDLLEIYRRLLARWHWVFAAALLAGALGFLVSWLRPPMYEASALLEIGIDRSRADVPDDVTLRQAHDRVRALVLADDTLQQAVSAGGLVPPVEGAVVAFRKRIRLSDQPDGWRLAVLATSAGEAERLAQAWAEVALGQIASASLHALRAADWQNVLYEASCHLVRGEGAADPARWVCRSTSPGGADELPASILSEVEASRGILPVFSYSLLQASSGTAQAVLWGRGSLILGGALAGLGVGGIAAAWRKRGVTA